jgi:hypothetical protein
LMLVKNREGVRPAGKERAAQNRFTSGLWRLPKFLSFYSLCIFNS